ncbi:hypothetical protein A4V09_23970 [Blautia pseudococcoides]|uniref:Uncharacterized protein n=1 Tax=Blautia pseudococcoides TaxID=1796616 RepID=A0A1V0QEQ1_9FIRM|nr:hypothetical protein A4V09_23970 [Blautia pseudococcoides]
MIKLTVYHGTDCIFQDIDLHKSIGGRDFGCGFYTTRLRRRLRAGREAKRYGTKVNLHMSMCMR